MESHMARFRLRRRPFKNALPASTTQSVTELLAGLITSCDRCRQFKKKCSRTPPECAGCAHAGVECSLGALACLVGLQDQEQSTWLDRSAHQKNKSWKNSDADAHRPTSAAAVIDKSSPTAPINSPPAQDSLPSTLAPIPPPSRQTTNQISNESPVSEEVVLERPSKRVRLEEPESQLGVSPQGHYSSPPTVSSLPSRRSLVDAYFRDVHRAYPFLDRSRILMALQAENSSVSISSQVNDVNATMLYLVLAIGHNTLQRAGQVSSNSVTPFEIKYKDIMSRYLGHESTDTVRILLLLAIYSLVDPQGYSTWPLIDIAASMTVRLGLNRREVADEGLTPKDAERQHRLFWSVYVFDRMAAASIGVPVTINEESVDVPLPGLTVEEFASPERMDHISTLQAARHIIQLRQLEDKVLHHLHLRARAETASLTHAACRRTATGLRTEIENWYSSGCLLKSAGTDDVTIHITISWLAARYYNLLFYLYYPSESESTTQLPDSELLSLVQKHIQANAVRFQQRQLPLNRATLYRLLHVCLIFLHCFLAHGSGEPFAAGEEIGLCADIMEAYAPEWSEARRGAVIMRQLASLVTNATTPRPGSLASAHPTFGEADQAWCHAIKVSLIQLAREVLGPGSVYIAVKNLWTHTGNDSPVRGKSLIDGPFQDSYRSTLTAQKGGTLRQDGVMTDVGVSADSSDLDAFVGNGFHIIDLL
ncbi:fungal-specific transcription factor domain-containing protein [Hypoxylon cercidicola]|nr:fungal-specific transcription factor domain-containing protein [Hypoxylon cercidicola]